MIIQLYIKYTAKKLTLQNRPYSGHKPKLNRDIKLVTSVYVNPKNYCFGVRDYQIYDREGDGKTKIDHLL